MDSSENLSHQVMDSDFGPESSWITVMCRASRFQITVSLKDLRGSCFEAEYSERVAKVDDMDGGSDKDYDTLCDWIVEPCFSYFRGCTTYVPKDLTFEEFYYPPTYHLKLVVSGSSFDAKATRDRHNINPFALMVPSRDLPKYPGVCRSRASDIRIVPPVIEAYDYMSEIPRQARISDGKVKLFTPALDKSQIIREIEMHSRIMNAGLKRNIRVANLPSIVICTDAKMIIGLLFDFIPSSIGESLQSTQCKMASEYHAKWKQQVTAIVKELHSHDIVWGNVYPGHIIIDVNLDAWIMDFGGG